MAIFNQTLRGSMVSLDDVRQELEKTSSVNLAKMFAEYETIQNEQLENNKLSIEKCSLDISDLIDRVNEREEGAREQTDLIHSLSFVLNTNMKIAQDKIRALEKSNKNQKAYFVLLTLALLFILISRTY